MEDSRGPRNSVNVLLIGNYANDRQESMRRFADLLAAELPARGIHAECLCPSPVFGRLISGAHGMAKWLGYLDKFLLFPRALRRRIKALGSESLVHICDHSNAVYAGVLARVPHLVTCHDLLAVRSALGEFPACKIRASGRFYQKMILRGLNTAQKVACVSKATCRDVLRLSKLASRQVALVYNGLNYPYGPLTEQHAAERLREAAPRLAGAMAAKVQEGFILHVGGNHWYKNRPGVIQIYAQLCGKMSSPPNLVMVGQSFTPSMRSLIVKHQLENRVIELNSVSNEDLRTLYCSAKLLLFPSSVEGFGWPIVEAQACGCPVVIARREPMTEIGGDTAVSFEFESHDEGMGALISTRSADNGASAIKTILMESGAERASRIQRGVLNAAQFSTARMMDDYVNLYQQLLSTQHASKVTRLDESLAVH
jgi:glycosyltransferase involved in cell wall biosynthesis